MTEGEHNVKDIYVLLDFQGKDSQLLKQPMVYFRILNLNENKPIVEIGDDVYEGTYDDVIGTNVFFEEDEKSVRNTNIFEGTTPITLKYLLKQTKVLKMKKIGLKSKLTLDTSSMEMVNIKIEEDYKTLLNKLQNGKLNIEDCVYEGTAPLDPDKIDEMETDDVTWESTQEPSTQNSISEWYPLVKDKIGTVENQTSPTGRTDTSILNVENPTYLKYLKLKQLCQQPTQHQINIGAEAYKFDQPLHFLPSSDFLSWKKFIMQTIEQQPINLDIKENKIEDFVDVENSVKAGIISSSNVNQRTFTEDEKTELLSFKNFINLSVLMKYIMLQDLIQLGRIAIQEMTDEQSSEINEDDCNIKERLNLLKTFRDELKAHIISRVQEESTTGTEFQLPSDAEENNSDSSYVSDENIGSNVSDTDVSVEDNNSSFEDAEGTNKNN